MLQDDHRGCLNVGIQHDASTHGQYMGHDNDGLGAALYQFNSLNISAEPAGTAESNISQVQGADQKQDSIYVTSQPALLKGNPTIPQAVPAIFTPPAQMKSIEQCLENPIKGNRNVYIRGLSPKTDDELLLHYVSRFGKVEQSKAIIDTSTGACKGFGFAKFANVSDSEKCIRGFYYLGYEVSFARESFNARLNAEGDENSTNLYLSNLSKSINEVELCAIFSEYHVVSSKILRDSMGNSRGAGFARFETREKCEEIIKKYHGFAVGDESLIMQVRYADTPAQKELKRITANRRQYRTNEYKIAAYGAVNVSMHPSVYKQDLE
ncbi:hypothetical protein B0H67DRAFT_594946 [Lasiosphaeris hirsuta]|uniref:RRM domain-containing protein n=1 Tax=Lasiosphaeris hirsuta TaxID=260670 RepID=A0AA40DJ61_9PEZI|nr:hypothetical protein B0H67DRAFT_594946 [Lasiosphaeris hirsuta]